MTDIECGQIWANMIVAVSDGDNYHHPSEGHCVLTSLCAAVSHADTLMMHQAGQVVWLHWVHIVRQNTGAVLSVDQVRRGALNREQRCAL